MLGLKEPKQEPLYGLSTYYIGTWSFLEACIDPFRTALCKAALKAGLDDFASDLVERRLESLRGYGSVVRV